MESQFHRKPSERFIENKMGIPFFLCGNKMFIEKFRFDSRMPFSIYRLYSYIESYFPDMREHKDL